MEKLKVIVVDDSKRFRESLKLLLENVFNVEIIAEASNGNEFLALEEAFVSDIIFMDLCMTNGNGWDTAKEFIDKYPNAKIVAVTMFTDKAYLVQLIEIGFKGCIYKNDIIHHIKNAIDSVMNGRLYFPYKMKLS